MADAKQGKAPIEDFYNGSTQSRVVLAKPRLGGFGSSNFASSSNKGCNPFSSILRPSQLKPGGNPFIKLTETTDKEADKTKEKDETPNEDRLKDSKEEADVPKFVPLGTNVSTRSANQVPAPVQPGPGSSSAGFVFGQNLSERVVIKENVNNGEACASEHSSSNGTAELLFTNAAASVKENQEEPASEASNGSEGLAAAAAEYERSHARPPPPTTNFTITGEEGETNVLQISCRLFAWEAGSWRERGRGVLRLNDGRGGAARLVARVAGSLRVVLNTKLWPDMVVERAGTKSLRITAADAQQQVKLFLIMGAPGDIVQLHKALTARISVSKKSTSSSCSQNSTSQQAAERLEAATDENEYFDKPEEDGGFEEKQALDAAMDDEIQDSELSNNERLEDTDEKTEEQESSVDDQGKETKSLKRKEPAEDETSPKRQCPEILIE